MNRKTSNLSLKCFSLALLTVVLWGVSATLAFGQIKPSRRASMEITAIAPNSVPIGATTKVTLTGKNITAERMKGVQYNCGGDVKFKDVEVTSPEHAVAQIVVPEDLGEMDCEPAMPRQLPVPFRIVVSANSRLRLRDVRLVGQGPMDAQQFQDKLGKLPYLDEKKRDSGAREAYDLKGLWVDSQTIKYVDFFGERVFEEPISAVKSTALVTGKYKNTLAPNYTVELEAEWLCITFSDGRIYDFDNGQGGYAIMLKKRLGK